MGSKRNDEESIDFAALFARIDGAQARLLDESASPADRRKVLEARAALLAKGRDEKETDDWPLLAFVVGGERYAVSLSQVDQLAELRDLCPLPGSPREVLGMMKSHTSIFPVLDLRVMLGLEGGGASDLTKVVVVIEQEPFGLAAEEVLGRVGVVRATVRRGLAKVGVLGVTADGLEILDLGQLFWGAAAVSGGVP